MIGILFKKLLRWIHLLPLLLMVGVSFVSRLPGTTVGSIIPPWDKILHFGAYLGLGLSICFCIRDWRWKSSPYFYGIFVMIFVALFGAFDEFHQSFIPGRNSSFSDWIANVLGGGLAVALFLIFRPWKWSWLGCRR